MRPQPALPPTGPDALRAELARWQDVAAHATLLAWDVPGVPGTRMLVVPCLGGWAVLRAGLLCSDWWCGDGWRAAVDGNAALCLPLPDAVAVCEHLAARETAHAAAWTPRLEERPRVEEHLAEYASGVAA